MQSALRNDFPDPAGAGTIQNDPILLSSAFSYRRLLGGLRTSASISPFCDWIPVPAPEVFNVVGCELWVVSCELREKKWSVIGGHESCELWEKK